MTNDEAIKEFQSELRWAELNEYPYVSKRKVEADKMVIKLLKQESVLDKINKIRAEIEQTAKDYDKFDDYRRVRGLWIALEIIDKYMAESNKESEE